MLPLDVERPVERDHRRERECHPEHARRQVGGGERGRIAREVEDDQHQCREDHRGKQSRPAPQLRADVLTRDGQGQPK